MVALSSVKAVRVWDPGEASFLSMPYAYSHTTPYVMCPTRYQACVLERCNDRIPHTAITNFSSMLGSGSTVWVTLVSGVRTICSVLGRYLASHAMHTIQISRILNAQHPLINAVMHNFSSTMFVRDGSILFTMRRRDLDNSQHRLLCETDIGGIFALRAHCALHCARTTRYF